MAKQTEAAEKKRPSRGALPYLLVFLVLQVILYALVLRVVQPDTPGREVSLDRLNVALTNGRLERATVLDYDSRIAGRDARGDFWVALPRGELAVNQMAGALASSGVETTIDQQAYKGTLNFLAQFLLPILLFFTLFGVLFLLFAGSSGMGGLSMFGKSKARRFLKDDDHLTFADVAGLDETIEELAEIKDFLKAPDRFAAMGARAPKGVLLVGPPGCGKTLLAKAVAGEAGVPFFSIAGSEFVEMLVGVGAARVRDLFATAKAAAPAIVFIDELDAVGRARSSSGFGSNEERDQTLNEMLVQMDGFGPETGLVVLTATNRADILDEALTRPGRFDRHIVVDLPDQTGRESILAVHLKGKPIGPDVDVTQVARRTPGFSGADLANVVNEAALLAARRGLTAIGKPEIEEGIDRALTGPERRSRLLTPRDKRIVAVHEAG
ncbi:MAG: AAA family ATPase, partial [Acidimicrobiales bacterium]